MQLGVCDWGRELDTPRCRWGNDCMGESGWETGDVYASLQRVTVGVPAQVYYRDVAEDIASMCRWRMPLWVWVELGVCI